MKKNTYNRKYYKDIYITVKNTIRESAAEFGGLFASDHSLNDANQWVDFFFMSKKDRSFWNAEIITAKLAYEDKLYDLAMEKLNSLLVAKTPDDSPLFKLADGKTTFTWEPAPEQALPELGGLKQSEWIEKEVRELAKSGKVFVTESTIIDDSFEYGKGLSIVTNVEHITVETINEFINAFIQNGEIASQSDTPLSFPIDMNLEAERLQAAS